MEEQAAEKKPGGNVVVLDLGKKKKKHVKKLRKGRGRLMSKIKGSIDDMKADGMLAADADAVVIVVKEKRKRNRFKW